MLTVLYDERCALCRRCRTWLEGQATLVPVGFLAAGSVEARTRYRSVPWLGADLVVVDDDGSVWAGSSAFLMCLWATEQYRGWAYRLSRRGLAPFAERFFRTVSANRRRIGAVVGNDTCPDGRCGHRGSPTPVASPPAGLPRCGRCGASVQADDLFCTDCGARR